MIEIDPQNWLTKPHPEQIRGVKHLVKGTEFNGIIRPNACLFDQPGVGKTKQIIDAACILYDARLIDVVVVVAPAGVRGVWDNREFGELAKHCWVPFKTARYESGREQIPTQDPSCLLWVIVSYGFIRKQDEKTFPISKWLIKQLKHRRYWFVLDESSYVKNRLANQYKASRVIRKSAARVTLLNGTPTPNGVVDLWAQFKLCDDDMLTHDVVIPMNFTQFRSKYAVMGGYQAKQIVGYDEEQVNGLKKYVKPWILRRKTEDCVDLPPKVYSILEAPMSTKAWRIYCEMRDNMIAWLENNPSQASHGAVKSIRLCQITSGFLGGIQFDIQGDFFQEQLSAVEEIDDAKLQTFLEWYKTIDSSEQIIVWCRFRKEIERTTASLAKLGKRIGLIYGGQNDTARQKVINDFELGNIDVLVGQPRAGGIGITLINAHIEVYMSNDFNLLTREQSEARAHRRGQTRQVLIYDILATSPTGKQTIDHTVLTTLQRKEEFANWTADSWRSKLEY